MKKREMIIVIIAAAALFYGALDFFVLSKQGLKNDNDNIASELKEITALAETSESALTEISSKTAFADVDYLIAKAESPWPGDPFITYDPDKPDDDDDDEKIAAEDVPPLAYTGFIQAGQKVLAIINDMEYSHGETLKDIGYTVHSITSSHVVLLTVSEKKIILQLQEN